MTNDAFLVLFLILIALMTIIPLFLRRLKVPAVIALLVAGMLISPNGLDLPGRLSPLLAMLGGTPETVRAHTWNFINSLGSLGLLFLMKDGPIPRDEKAAFFWFNRAASKGCSAAQRQLAVCYENGVGCEADQEKAMALYYEAARNGDVEARRRLNK